MKYRFENKTQINKLETAVFFTSKDSLKIPSLSSKELAELKKDFKGEFKEVVFYRNSSFPYKNLCLVGVGAKSELTQERLRQAAGVVYDHLKTHKCFSAHILLDTLSFLSSKKDWPSWVSAVLEGFRFKDYRYDQLKTDKKKQDSFDLVFSSVGSVKTAKVSDALKNSQIMMDQIDFARELGDSPGNIVDPVSLASKVQSQAKGVAKLKVTVFDKKRITKEKMGGLLSVASGGNKEPRFIIMEYKGAAASKKPLCLVGKGITFDSGGLSLKPPRAMEEMRYDMCGAAAVAGAVLAISKMKLKVNVVGLIAASENLTGPAATKPGDIIRSRKGKTVEVLNTDAEGRLVLMDALDYACDKIKPAAICDAATLTGAIVVCLSNIYTGAFTNHDSLWNKVNKAAQSSGEKVWRLPLDEHFSKDMKSKFSDLQNISSYPGGGSSTAAAFLQNFVDPKIPWVHFDIAGTAWSAGNRLEYLTKHGASGVLIRTFIELSKIY